MLQIGSFRACILTTWISVVFDYIGKLRQLAMSGDSNADQQIKSLAQLLKTNNVTELLKFERGMLEKAKDDFEFITSIEYEDLKRLAEDRDRCAHPAMRSVDEPYYPTAETARYHLRNAVNYMLQRPPAHGKVFVDKLIDQVESNYFPEDVKKAVAYFQNTPLVRPRTALLRNFVIVLLKRMVAVTSDDIFLLLRYISALKATLELHRVDVATTLSQNASQILSRVLESDYWKLIRVLYHMPELWGYVRDDLKLKLGEYVKALPDSDKPYILKIVFKFDLFAVSAETLLFRLTEEDISDLLDDCLTYKEVSHENILERAVELYVDSESFAAANHRAQRWLIPFLRDLKERHIVRFLEAAKQNDQILNSFELETVLKALCEISEEYTRLVSGWFAELSDNRRTKDLKAAVFPLDEIPF